MLSVAAGTYSLAVGRWTSGPPAGCGRMVPARPPAPGRRAARSMFERFTDRARRVVVLAQEEARMFNHDYVGTEHILLALIREEGGVAAQARERLGITGEGLRQQVEEIVGRDQPGPQRGHLPMTPRAKKVLQLSL